MKVKILKKINDWLVDNPDIQIAFITHACSEEYEAMSVWYEEQKENSNEEIARSL